jgi:hypothetical protein
MIGITRTKEREEKIGKHSVIFIEQSDLREASLVAAGACEQAFARIIDARYNGSLEDSVKSKPFAIKQGLHNVRVQRAKSKGHLPRLSDRLAVLEAQNRM